MDMSSYGAADVYLGFHTTYKMWALVCVGATQLEAFTISMAPGLQPCIKIGNCSKVILDENYTAIGLENFVFTYK